METPENIPAAGIHVEFSQLLIRQLRHRGAAQGRGYHRAGRNRRARRRPVPVLCRDARVQCARRAHVQEPARGREGRAAPRCDCCIAALVGGGCLLRVQAAPSDMGAGWPRHAPDARGAALPAVAPRATLCAGRAGGLRPLPRQHLQRRRVHALVAGGDDAAARIGRPAFPGRNHAAGAGDDRDQRHDVVGFELGLDDEIDVAGRQHAIGVAVAAIA